MPDSAAPGWYLADPDSHEQRYWDGAAWTDFYSPPRPGQPLTAEQAADQAAHQTAPATIQQAVVPPGTATGKPAKAANRKPRRRLIVILAGAVAVAVAATAVIVAVTGASNSSQARLVNGYEYLPAIHVKPAQVIELPVDYDFSAKVEAVNPKGSELDPDYTDKVVAVYTNSEFTSDAQTRIESLKTGTVTITPGEDDVTGFADTTPNERDYGRGGLAGGVVGLAEVTSHLNRGIRDYKSWGLFDTYYIVQHFSRAGVRLKHPTVTPVIPSGDKLATPRVTVAPTEGDAGSITFNWTKVKRATQYVILSYSNSVDAEHQVTIEGVVDGSTTTWSSSESAKTATYFGLKLAKFQNVGLETYGHISADDQQSGFFSQFATNHPLYGVMALRGAQGGSKLAKEYSAMGTVDSAVAAALPSSNAIHAEIAAFPDAVVTSIDQLPLLFPYTSLDGNTRQTRGILKPGFAVMRDGSWNLMMQGAGVDLGFGVSLAAAIEPNAFIAAYNAKSLAAAPRTGLSSLPILASTVASGGNGPVSHSAPDTGYPVFGNDTFAKYIAANMIAHQTAVDISKFPASDVANLGAFVSEAQTQNPYIFDLVGYGLSADRDTMYVSYGFSADQTTKLQQAVQAKVKSVVAEVTTSSMSANAKVTALNDWLTAHVAYNYAALGADPTSFVEYGYPKGFESAWDPDGALLDGSAVCGGYAAAFDLLANAAGIPAIVVTGDVKAGGRHAWNKVNVDGAWKDVDTTWNDAVSAPNQYLLINDDQFTGAASRSEDESWMPLQAQSRYATK